MKEGSQAGMSQEEQRDERDSNTETATVLFLTVIGSQRTSENAINQ